MSVAPDTSPAARLARGARRPVRLIALIARMILGAGLAVALILKVYMAVLTDHVCVADAETLGNAIRCTPSLLLAAYVLALSAGFELALRLFTESIEHALTPLIPGFAAALLIVLGGAEGGLGWREALVILALTAALGAVLWIIKTFLRDGSPDA